MYDLMADYRALIGCEPVEFRQTLQAVAPRNSAGQWALAILDIACTDYYPVNLNSSTTFSMRMILASRLLDFMESELGAGNSVTFNRACIKVGRRVVEENAHHVAPASLRPDAVVKRVLQSFQLSREQALSVAAVERDRFLDALGRGLEGHDFEIAVQAEGVSELHEISSLLTEARCFRNEITGSSEIIVELDSWLEIYPRLGLGDEVASLLNTRMKESRRNS